MCLYLLNILQNFLYMHGGYIGKYVLWRNTLSSDESFEIKNKIKLNALDGICVILRVEWYLCLEFYIRFMAKCIYQVLIGFYDE